MLQYCRHLTSHSDVRRRQACCTRCRPTARTGFFGTHFAAENAFSVRNQSLHWLLPLTGTAAQYCKHLRSRSDVQPARETSATDLYALSADSAYRCFRDTFRRGKRVFLRKPHGQSTVSAARHRRAILQGSVVRLRRLASPWDVANRPVRVVGRQRVQVLFGLVLAPKTGFLTETTRLMDYFR